MILQATLPSDKLYFGKKDRAYFLNVPENCVVEKPITLTLSHGDADQPLTLIVFMGAYSKATVIEDFSVAKGDAEIIYHQLTHASEYSGLRLVHFQNLSSETSVTEKRDIDCAEAAHVDLTHADFGAGNVRSTLNQRSTGIDAVMNTDLITRTHGGQNYDFAIKNNFTKSRGKGVITARGIALDESVLGMHGIIQIGPLGAGTDAYLSQAALNLSPKAKVKATPALEIDTNDVKAGHSASVTNLSDEDLFYMTSRGLSLETARKMLMEGFLRGALAKLSDLPDLQKRILKLL